MRSHVGVSLFSRIASATAAIAVMVGVVSAITATPANAEVIPPQICLTRAGGLNIVEASTPSRALESDVPSFPVIVAASGNKDNTDARWAQEVMPNGNLRLFILEPLPGGGFSKEYLAVKSSIPGAAVMTIQASSSTTDLRQQWIKIAAPKTGNIHNFFLENAGTRMRLTATGVSNSTFSNPAYIQQFAGNIGKQTFRFGCLPR